MKPELLGVILGAIVAVCQFANLYLFSRIRIAQLESEKRVLDEVDAKYVRRDSPQRIRAASGC